MVSSHTLFVQQFPPTYLLLSSLLPPSSSSPSLQHPPTLSPLPTFPKVSQAVAKKFRRQIPHVSRLVWTRDIYWVMVPGQEIRTPGNMPLKPFKADHKLVSIYFTLQTRSSLFFSFFAHLSSAEFFLISQCWRISFRGELSHGHMADRTAFAHGCMASMVAAVANR